MKLTDNIYSLYIRSILIPKMEDYSNPGYVYTKLTRDSREIMLRDVFVPEELVAEIEAKTVEKYGDEGRKTLYRIGKNSCYVYSKFSGFETVETTPNLKKLEEYVRLLVLFIAGTYGADVDYELDIKNKVQKISFSNYVVCQKNGIGEIFASGSAAGMWAWILQDNNIEVVQYKCVGRGDKTCSLLIALPETIEKRGYTAFKASIQTDIDLTEEYLHLNKPYPTEAVKLSLEKLIAFNVIEFKDGRITFHQKRYFECDSHYVYFLELMHNDQNLLFEVTKEYYKKVGEDIGDKLSTDYIAGFLGAMGWGDIMIHSGPRVQLRHYPYTTLYDKTKYTVIRGVLSGLLSAVYKNDVNLKEATTVFDDENTFSVILE
ncbi:MAG: hypothetical protein NTU61_05120 [Candidatus Altiarchaeota archaeon]|nr:hypothetical protein [Candidatus Altiarchaeota archaeon]